MEKKFYIGDICLVDLPKCGIYCRFGKHPCVVTGKSGSNYRVVPISSNRGMLKECEYPINKGRCGVIKDSKLKLDQERPISEELIIRKLGIVDREIRKAISDFKKKEAQKIENDIAIR